MLDNHRYVLHPNIDDMVAEHMTIYLTRNRGPIWERPLPSWKLILPCESTQVVGTPAVVYRWFMTPTGWSLALLVWIYALVFLTLSSALKISVYHLLRDQTVAARSNLPRAESPVRRRPVP